MASSSSSRGGKYSAEKHPLLVEKRIGKMTPQDPHKRAMIDRYIDISAQRATSPQERAAWFIEKAHREVESVDHQIDAEWKDDFRAWVCGNSPFNTKKHLTPWGRQPLFYMNTGVRKFLQDEHDMRHDFRAALLKLQMAGPGKTIEQAYLYYKFIVRAMDWAEKHKNTGDGPMTPPWYDHAGQLEFLDAYSMLEPRDPPTDDSKENGQTRRGDKNETYNYKRSISDLFDQYTDMRRFAGGQMDIEDDVEEPTDTTTTTTDTSQPRVVVRRTTIRSAPEIDTASLTRAINSMTTQFQSGVLAMNEQQKQLAAITAASAARNNTTPLVVPNMTVGLDANVNERLLDVASRNDAVFQAMVAMQARFEQTQQQQTALQQQQAALQEQQAAQAASTPMAVEPTAPVIPDITVMMPDNISEALVQRVATSLSALLDQREIERSATLTAQLKEASDLHAKILSDPTLAGLAGNLERMKELNTSIAAGYTAFQGANTAAQQRQDELDKLMDKVDTRLNKAIADLQAVSTDRQKKTPEELQEMEERQRISLEQVKEMQSQAIDRITAAATANVKDYTPMLADIQKHMQQQATSTVQLSKDIAAHTETVTASITESVKTITSAVASASMVINEEIEKVKTSAGTATQASIDAAAAAAAAAVAGSATSTSTSSAATDALIEAQKAEAKQTRTALSSINKKLDKYQAALTAINATNTSNAAKLQAIEGATTAFKTSTEELINALPAEMAKNTYSLLGALDKQVISPLSIQLSKAVELSSLENKILLDQMKDTQTAVAAGNTLTSGLAAQITAAADQSLARDAAIGARLAETYETVKAVGRTTTDVGSTVVQATNFTAQQVTQSRDVTLTSVAQLSSQSALFNTQVQSQLRSLQDFNGNLQQYLIGQTEYMKSAFVVLSNQNDMIRISLAGLSDGFANYTVAMQTKSARINEQVAFVNELAENPTTQIQQTALARVGIFTNGIVRDAQELQDIITDHITQELSSVQRYNDIVTNTTRDVMALRDHAEQASNSQITDTLARDYIETVGVQIIRQVDQIIATISVDEAASVADATTALVALQSQVRGYPDDEIGLKQSYVDLIDRTMQQIGTARLNAPDANVYGWSQDDLIALAQELDPYTQLDQQASASLDEEGMATEEASMQMTWAQADNLLTAQASAPMIASEPIQRGAFGDVTIETVDLSGDDVTYPEYIPSSRPVQTVDSIPGDVGIENPYQIIALNEPGDLERQGVTTTTAMAAAGVIPVEWVPVVNNGLLNGRDIVVTRLWNVQELDAIPEKLQRYKAALINQEARVDSEGKSRLMRTLRYRIRDLERQQLLGQSERQKVFLKTDSSIIHLGVNSTPEEVVSMYVSPNGFDFALDRAAQARRLVQEDGDLAAPLTATDHKLPDGQVDDRLVMAIAASLALDVLANKLPKEAFNAYMRGISEMKAADDGTGLSILMAAQKSYADRSSGKFKGMGSRRTRQGRLNAAVSVST